MKKRLFFTILILTFTLLAFSFPALAIQNYDKSTYNVNYDSKYYYPIHTPAEMPKTEKDIHDELISGQYFILNNSSQSGKQKFIKWDQSKVLTEDAQVNPYQFQPKLAKMTTAVDYENLQPQNKDASRCLVVDVNSDDIEMNSIHFETKSSKSDNVYVYYYIKGLKYYLNFNASADNPELCFTMNSKKEFDVTYAESYVPGVMSIYLKDHKHKYWICMTEDGHLGISDKSTSIALVYSNFSYTSSSKRYIRLHDGDSTAFYENYNSTVLPSGLNNDSKFVAWSIYPIGDSSKNYNLNFFKAKESSYSSLNSDYRCSNLYALNYHDLNIKTTADDGVTSIPKPTITHTLGKNVTISGTVKALASDKITITYPDPGKCGYTLEIDDRVIFKSGSEYLNPSYTISSDKRTLTFDMTYADLEVIITVSSTALDVPEENWYSYAAIGSASEDNDLRFLQKELTVKPLTQVRLKASLDSGLTNNMTDGPVVIHEFKDVTSAENAIETNLTSLLDDNISTLSLQEDTPTTDSNYNYWYDWYYCIGSGESKTIVGYTCRTDSVTFYPENLQSFSENCTLTVWCRITKQHKVTNKAIAMTTDEIKINIDTGSQYDLYVSDVDMQLDGRMSDKVMIGFSGISSDALAEVWDKFSCTVTHNNITENVTKKLTNQEFSSDEGDLHMDVGMSFSSVKTYCFEYMITENGTYTFTVTNEEGAKKSITYQYNNIVSQAQCKPMLYDTDTESARINDKICITTDPEGVFNSISSCWVKEPGETTFKEITEQHKIKNTSEDQFTVDNVYANNNGKITYRKYYGACYLYNVTKNGTYTFKLKDRNGYWTSEQSITYNNIHTEPNNLNITPPDKTEYELGGKLDLTGMKVIAEFDDGTTADVTSSASVSALDSTTHGEKVLTVSAMGKTAELKVTVNKGKSYIDGLKAVPDLFSDGITAYQLITEPKASGGTIYYAFGTDNITAPSSGWTTTIPSAIDNGTYYVWYKLVGDEDYEDIEPQCIKTLIAKKPEIIFHTNGGTSLSNITLNRPGDVVESSSIGDTTRTNYIFVNWYTNANLTKVWDKTAPVTTDLDVYAKWVKETYTVSGKVIGKNLEGAVVTLYKGDVAIAEDTIEAGDISDYNTTEYPDTHCGEFSFGTDIAADLYTVTVENDKRKASSSLQVSDHITDFVIPLEDKIYTSMDSSDDTQEHSASGLNEFAKNIKSEQDSKNTLEVTLNITEVNANSEEPGVQNIAQQAGDKNIVYFDVTLYKCFEDPTADTASNPTEVTDTGNNVIALTFAWDTTEKNITVYRYHDGQVEELTESSSHLDGTFEVFDGYVVIYTTKFSTYALASTHTMTYHEAHAASCTAAGNTEYWSCSDCGKYFSDADGNTEIAANSWVIKKIAHNMTYHEAHAASCTVDGNNEYWSCSQCNKYYADANGYRKIAENSWVIQNTKHKMTHHVAHAASCTAAGNTEYWSCSQCNKYFSDVKGNTEITENSWVLPITEHTWDSGVITKEATTSETGVKTYTCTECDTTKTETISKLQAPTFIFNDVTTNDYFYEAVNWAAANNITNGVGNNNFAPYQSCTRSQAVTFLWRAAGCPEPAISTNPFNDVKSSDYFYKAVLWAVEQGITNGTTDNTFSPNDGCTRGQVVTFLWRANGMQKANIENPFSDVKSCYYYDAVLWAVENDITTGVGNGTFAPEMICQRGQIVTFLFRFYN